MSDLTRELSSLSFREAKKLEKTLLGMKDEASQDPEYFFDNFLYTFDPRVEPFHLRFKLFPFQRRLVRQLVKSITAQSGSRIGEDLFIEKSRDMGATYVVLGVFLWMWLFRPGSVFVLGSRKEEYVDNRRGGEAGNKEESLFGKLDYMVSKLPGFVMPRGWDSRKHFNYMSLYNPDNGNSISGESSNDNFARGSRKTAVLFDEFAFWESGQRSWGSAGSSTNCRIALTTPGSKPSKAKRLRFGQDGETIKVVSFLYKEDPRKTPKWLEQERQRFSEEDFNREVMLNWELSFKGRIYPEMSKAEYGKFPFLKNEQLFVSGDYGLDGTSFLFWQQNPDNGKWRLVNSFHYEEEPIEYSFPFWGKPIDSKFQYNADMLEQLEVIKKYPPAIHFGDPSINKRSGNEDKKSDRDKLAAVGVHVSVFTEKNTIDYRVNTTKVFLQKGIEVNDTPGNLYAYEAFKGYRWKTVEEGSENTSNFRKPVHSWESHPSTAMEYLFVNIENYNFTMEQEPDWANQKGRWLTSRSSIIGG